VLWQHICPWCVCAFHSLESYSLDTRVPLYTVQCTHSASLHCVVPTQRHSTLCSTHTVLLYTVQYPHSATLHCAVHTQCLSTLCSAHTVPLYTVQYPHSATLHCAVHTQCLSTLCSTHTVPLYTVQYTHTHTHTPQSQYAAITPTTSISTDTIEPLL